MRRTTYLATVAIIIAVAGYVLLPFLISTQSIAQRLNERIVELTYNKLTYKGEPKLTLSPFLQIKLLDVVLENNEEQGGKVPLVHIEELIFKLKTLPLLFGKIRLTGFRLIRPKFSLNVDENGAINWIKAPSSNFATSQNPDASSVLVGRFDIVDGIFVTNLHAKADPVRISNLNAKITWPDLASAWEISGNGVWSGERFEFYNKTDDPSALFSSSSSAVRFSIDSPALVASFNGMANTASSIQLRGKSKIDIPSLPRLIELMGYDSSAAKPPIGKVHIDGTMSADTGEISFNEANVNLGGNIATGNLLFYRRGEHRAKISGTLAFGSLDLTPFLDAATSSLSAGANGALDLDVRFSAQSYQLSSNTFGTMAATALVSGKDWTFDIGEAELFDGMIVGKISSKSTKGVDEIELKGVLQNVSMESISRTSHGADIFAAGIANAKFNLKASDNAALHDFRKFSGSIGISMSEGRLEGIDITKAIPALDENNGFVTFDEIKGVTPFGKLVLDLIVHNGVGWIIKGTAQSETGEFRLSGKADMLHGGLAIYTDIRGLKGSGKSPQSARIFVGGTVRNPLVTRSPLPLNRPDERPPTDG